MNERRPMNGRTGVPTLLFFLFKKKDLIILTQSIQRKASITLSSLPTLHFTNHTTHTTMQIQQAIIVIMLTAVISIFVGMVSMSVYPPSSDAVMSQLNKLSRTTLFGFIMIPWVFIVCITDLYITQGTTQQDITQMLNQCSSSSGT